MRTTIDYGIDLGTTNSSIAVLDGTDVQVFRDNEGRDYTPSAVWIDKQGRLFTGRQAYEHLDSDRENAFNEFKRQMGSEAVYKFARSGRAMRPEELSAEILKALREVVSKRRPEEVSAAVITVPAAFELPQCEATNKAAQMAGLTASPLLQEPVAAAMAYGFQSKSDRVFWLVYDFGGGTFDAAVISIRDGVIQVVNHGGDNHLGGKDIDWAIVNDLLVPAVLKEHKLTGFSRQDPKWAGAFAKLKLHAEQAKIRVSRDGSSQISIEYLCNNDSGQPVSFEYDLQKADVERLMEPLVLRSVNTCRTVLSEKRLAPGDIEKIVLVGGPTQSPYLRQRLADPREGLGITLDFSVDPMTVVARGAAVFAGTQRFDSPQREIPAGEFTVALDYKPVGSDPEPIVGGCVSYSSPANLKGYTIEIINPTCRPPWRSGKIPIAGDGKFVATLYAEPGRENIFEMELRDPAGNLRKMTGDRLAYKIGMVITDPPLTHTVGVALANNEMRLFAEKGTPLPHRKRDFLRTAFDAKAGQKGDAIRVPVVEGGNLRRANRNHLIGVLVVEGTRLRRDVPAGSEVEVVIDIDQSRLIRTKAYIPYLDEEFETVLKFKGEEVTAEKLKTDLAAEKKRLDEVWTKVNNTNDEKARTILRKIDGERMVHDVEAALDAAQGDKDAADKCAKRLLDLRNAIDEAEDALEWPVLAAEAEDSIKRTNEVLAAYGKPPDKEQGSSFVAELRDVLKTRDPDLTRNKMDALLRLRVRILREQPGWWVGWLETLEKQKNTLRDRDQAAALINQARRAVNNNDLAGLKAAVQQLWDLMPADQRTGDMGFGSTVIS
ncbi:MAG: Hsp70 family protein [Bryobacteraceae bacterium]